MEKIKKTIYKFALSDKNFLYRFFTKKKPVKIKYGENYPIKFNNSSFDNCIEYGKGGIIFDIHGGGYLFGNYMDENHFCHFIHENTGMTVVSCNYDLSTKSKFPTQIEQIYQTIKTIVKDERIDTSKIYIMGHSAGGNATAALTLLANKKKDFKVDGEILNYPVLDLNGDPKNRPYVKGNILSPNMMEYFNVMYFKSVKDSESPYASPVLATDEEIKKLPSTYILTCKKDSLRVDGLTYAKRLKTLGVQVTEVEVNEFHGFLENGMHNFYGKKVAFSKNAKEETNKICDWLNKEKNK